MRFLIFQSGEPLAIDKSESKPMRAISLSSELAKRGHEVTLISSDFFHQAKIHRYMPNKKLVDSNGVTTYLVSSPGYRSNIGLMRLVDHAVLSINLARQLFFLIRKSKPDLIFIGFPPIEAAFVCILFAKVFRIRSVLDVKDLWPELFFDSFTGVKKAIVRFGFLPYELIASWTIRHADYLSSMTSAYLNYLGARHRRSITSLDAVNPLTSPSMPVTEEEALCTDSFWASKGVYRDGIATFIFVGSFMTVFDFTEIAVAAKRALDENLACRFIIAGSGQCATEVNEIFSNLSNCVLPGWINHAQYNWLANVASGALLPYKNIRNYTLNMPNKAVDAIRHGLPIITPLEGYISELIRSKEIGYNYSRGSSNSLFLVIKYIVENPQLNRVICKNALELYNQSYEYSRCYVRLCETLETICSQQKE
jgi:glycosyltransferase involved in cell wall biosynthesis